MQEHHFENIQQIIINEINMAEFIIYAAVAWITDYKIIEALVRKRKSGVHVELVINDDERLDKLRRGKFEEFKNHGGELFLYPCDNNLMHSKFCVIDLATTITGSYNWSYKKEYVEDITIHRESIESATQYARQFKKIKQKSSLFEVKKELMEAHYVRIFQNIILSGGKGNDYNTLWLQLDDQDKAGSISLLCQYEPLEENVWNLNEKLPDTVYGYWKEQRFGVEYPDINKLPKNLSNDQILKWIEDNKKKVPLHGQDGKLEYYFECLDPNLLQYLI